jgi:hypothetical protein
MKSILLAVLILLSVCVYGQDPLWGFHIGAGSSYSCIRDLGKTLVSDPKYKNYGFEQDKHRFANWDANFGLQYEVGKTKHFLMCWLPEFNLSLSSAQFKDNLKNKDLKYKDSLGLRYEMNFNYDYFVINPASLRFGYKSRTGDEPKAKDYQGFIELSMPYHINISNTNLTYISNVKNNEEEDLIVQSELQKYIIGNNYFGFKFGAGGMYHFFDKAALTLRAGYDLGFKDVITTQANAHGFINNTNKRTAWNGSIGVAIYFY